LVQSVSCVDRDGEVCATRALGRRGREITLPGVLDYAWNFGSRLGRPRQQAKTGLAGDADGRRENASAEILRLRSGLRQQAPARLKRLAHARLPPQLYKKQASIRKSVNALDFTGVRCLRIVYGLISIRKPCSGNCFYNAEAGGAEEDGSDENAIVFEDATKGSRQIPRLRSGLRLRGSRFGFPLRQAQGHARKTAQHRSFDFAQDFPSACTSGQALRVPARLNPFDKLRVTPAKRLNTDPSTSLRISLRLAPQGRLCGFPLG